jgi:hypothetical protein
MTPSLKNASQSQQERLAYLELMAYFFGVLRRSDIERRFGVRPAAATRDLALYRSLVPLNLEYDGQARCYKPTATFSPLFAFQDHRVLSFLLLGHGDGLDLHLQRPVPCEGPGNLTQPNIQVLAAVTRAIHASKPLKVRYLSLSSGTSEREIVPVALADNGQRWHVRAFDRTRHRFGDFVLTRIQSVQSPSTPTLNHEKLEADEQWQRYVDCELVPHPGVQHPQAIEADYSMSNGVLLLRTRAALAGYVLRRWNVDSSPNHRLDSTVHHLWLRNPDCLSGVASATLAPGYMQEGEGA